MKEAIKKITKKLKEIDINYELSDDNTGVIISLYNEKTDLSVRYLISLNEFNDGSFGLTIFTSDILKVKNEIEVLKTLNQINWNNNFIYYFISEEKKVHMKANSFETIDNVAQDSLSLIREINNCLEIDYEKIMKSNWS